MPIPKLGSISGEEGDLYRIDFSKIKCFDDFLDVIQATPMERIAFDGRVIKKEVRDKFFKKVSKDEKNRFL